MKITARVLGSRRVWLWAAALALAVGLAADGRHLIRAWRFNAAIDAAATASAPLARAEAAELLFVRAHAAARAGRTQEALALYQAAARDPRVAPAAHYNSGNVHLREALALADANLLGQRPQAVELAKQRYRDALHADPHGPVGWPARYNLERALRLAPEVDEDTSAPPTPRQSERAVTTLRGFTLGLP
jgi:mxaK protein